MQAKCWDKNWKYVNAAATDIRVTIAKEKKRLAAQEKAKVEPVKVTQIRKATK